MGGEDSNKTQGGSGNVRVLEREEFLLGPRGKRSRTVVSTLTSTRATFVTLRGSNSGRKVEGSRPVDKEEFLFAILGIRRARDLNHLWEEDGFYVLFFR